MFNRSHPFIFNVYSLVIPSGITFLIISVLAPFHFQEFNLGNRIILGLLTAFIVAFTIFFTVKFLQLLLLKFMSDDDWTVGKELFLILFVLCILSLVISLVLVFSGFEYQSVYQLIINTIFTTLAIGILPVFIMVLFEQYQHQKKQLRKAKKLNASLELKKKQSSKEMMNEEQFRNSVLIKSDKGKIELKLNFMDLIYIKSEGNYLEIYYLHNGDIQKKLIRNTLKNIESTLPSEIFIRCHNRFIVNGHFIQKIEGNARNLLLHLKETSEEIPVSRAKYKNISAFLENLT